MIEKRTRIRLDAEMNKIEDAKEKTRNAKDVSENNVKDNKENVEIIANLKSKEGKKGDKKKLEKAEKTEIKIGKTEENLQKMVFLKIKVKKTLSWDLWVVIINKKNEEMRSLMKGVTIANHSDRCNFQAVFPLCDYHHS